jgi:hypothetical protein
VTHPLANATVQGFTSIVRGDRILFPEELEMSQVPVKERAQVRVTTTITVGVVEPGRDAGATFTWTRETAEAIRDALVEALGPA